MLSIDDNQIHITERRVKYDTDRLACCLKNSGLYEAAPTWCEIILSELNAGFGCVMPFLQFVESYAGSINDHERPFSVKTWTEAFNLWQNF